MRETTHGDRGEINPEDSTRKQPREKTSRTEVGPWWVITVIEKRNLKLSSCSDKLLAYLWSELSRRRKVPGEDPFKTSLAFSPEILPQYQQDSRRTDRAAKWLLWQVFSLILPLTVNKSMILCSDFFSFRWRDEPFCSRFLNWSTCETGLVFSSFRDSSSQKRFSFEAQLAREPQLCASRMFGERTIHGPQ